MFNTKFGRLIMLAPDKGANGGVDTQQQDVDVKDPKDGNDDQHPETDPEPSDVLPKTPDELRALINSEADKRVNKQKEAWDQKTQAAIEEAVSKAAERAQMTEKERMEADRKERERQNEREKETLRRQVATYKTQSLLAAKGLPQDPVFTESFIREDDETTGLVIDQFKTAFDSAVAAEVEKRMAGTKVPKAGGVSQPTKAAKEYTYDEIQELYQTNPEHYKAIMAQL